LEVVQHRFNLRQGLQGIFPLRLVSQSLNRCQHGLRRANPIGEFDSAQMVQMGHDLKPTERVGEVRLFSLQLFDPRFKNGRIMPTGCLRAALGDRRQGGMKIKAGKQLLKKQMSWKTPHQSGHDLDSLSPTLRRLHFFTLISSRAL
jgi:hypothetical protein